MYNLVMSKFQMFAPFSLMWVFISATPALGFVDVGHEVVAKIAWTQLDETTKTRVSELLKELKAHYEEASSFTTTAKIADNMKGGISAFDSWHYVSLPYAPFNMTVPTLDKTNVVTALCQAVKTLSDNPKKTQQAKPFEKAFMLQFLSHLVGDIHQPMHCVTRYTPLQPEGDKGGNLFTIIVDQKPINLHLFWDLGLGLFGDGRAPYVPTVTESPKSAQLAESIIKEFPKKKFGDAVSNVVFQGWALDSHKIAREKSYNLPEGAAPSEAYIKKGQKIIKERVALAGYRLAYLLNNLLKDGTTALSTGCP